MKLATYFRNGSTSFGIISNDQVIDIPSIWPGPDCPSSILELLNIEGGLEKTSKLTQNSDISTPLNQAKLLAPILRPGKVIGLAGNYAEHIKEAGLALGLSDSPRLTTTPRPFLMPSTCIIGPDKEIPWPVYSQDIDFELELAIVIGKTASRITPENALAHVAGYTIANDISARSVTYKSGRASRPWDEFYDWLNGKWADGFCPTGPFLVTKDEIPDIQNLSMRLTVNGEIRQNANTSQMIYSVADIVSFISHIMTLEPGDIIATGTPHGVGMKDKRFLNPGDEIVCSIEKLGTLANTLGPRPAQFYKPLER